MMIDKSKGNAQHKNLKPKIIIDKSKGNAQYKNSKPIKIVIDKSQGNAPHRNSKFKIIIDKSKRKCTTLKSKQANQESLDVHKMRHVSCSLKITPNRLHIFPTTCYEKKLQSSNLPNYIKNLKYTSYTSIQ